MPNSDYQLFICGHRRSEGHPRGSCAEKGGALVAQAIQNALVSKGLVNKVALMQTTCIGPCHTGCNVLVYPGGHLYVNIGPEQAESIVDSHLINGEVITDLLAPEGLW